MSQTSTPLPAPKVSDAPDQPEPASEPEALYESCEAESPVPLRTGIGEAMPARPQADAGGTSWLTFVPAPRRCDAWQAGP